MIIISSEKRVSDARSFGFDPAQMPRLEEIHANLVDRLREAKEHGWPGEVAAIETTIAAADQKLVTMRTQMAQRTTANLGMPSIAPAVGRSRLNQ
jgi:hypothetical protein